MSIAYNEAAKTITIQTAETEYQMAIDRYGCLRHVYYGRTVGGEDLRELHRSYDRGFSGSPYRAGRDRSYSLDTVCQEFSSCGVGDFRVPSLGVQNADGSCCAELRYVGHEIRAGKYSLPGLPAAWDSDGSAETLEITLRDPVTALTVRLLYGVFPERDVIARTAIYENGGAEPIVLEKAGSVCLELPFGNWDLMHFHGRHCLERKPERLPVMNGVQTLGSRRGMSSHEHNPFLILCDRQATEDHGECIGLMYLWSGSFRAEVEREQFGSVRAVMSPGDESFRWTLAPGERFAAPEVLLSRAEGLTRLSQQFHRMVRENVCRGEYRLAHRPVLINSWEAAYFDIRADRILDLARRAADLGMELFVLDDGWFHGRTDDNAGLGDWFENREKLPEGLDSLIRGIRALGLLFGLWVEPEMVSENSDLYRAHPDWALAVPGRAPMLGRNQLVLDLSRREVQDYIIEAMSGLLERYDLLDWLAELEVRGLGSGLPVYLAGVSMGATTVMLAAGLPLPERVHGVMADCGFTSAPDIWESVWTGAQPLPYALLRGAVERLAAARLGLPPDADSTLSALARWERPALFIHGLSDHFVPPEMTKRSYAACAGPKRLLLVEGAGHALSYPKDPAAYQAALLDFWQAFDAWKQA